MRVVGQVDDDLSVGTVFTLSVQDCLVGIDTGVKLAVADLIGSALQSIVKQGNALLGKLLALSLS